MGKTKPENEQKISMQKETIYHFIFTVFEVPGLYGVLVSIEMAP